MNANIRSYRNWIVCLVLLVMPGLHAETPVELGFVRLVNVVSQPEGATHFRIGEKDLAENGYRTGYISDGIGLEPGPHTITARHPGIPSSATQLEIKAGETLTVIAFSESIPAKKLGDPPTWRFRFLKLKQESVDAGNRFSFVSVSIQNEVKFQIRRGEGKAEGFALERFSISQLDLGESDDGVHIFDKKKPLVSAVPESPSHSVVVIFDGPDGSLSALVFEDSEFSIAG